MIIKEINLTRLDTSTYGLFPVKMTKLNNIVLLAGKNGSGKTRFLKLLKEKSKNYQSIKKMKNEASSQIIFYQQNIQNKIKELENLNKEDGNYEKNQINIKITIDSLQKSLEMYQEIKDYPLKIITDTETNNIAIIDFVPKEINLDDWANLSKNDWTMRANNAKNPGTYSLKNSTIPLIQLIMDRWFRATHPKINLNEEEKKIIIENYNKLQNLIKTFLGVEIELDKDGYSNIFNKRIAQAELSAGQIILLQLAIAIFAQGGNLSNYILFMDEPENHLHPSAVIDFIDLIQKYNPNGQIWIATHSVPLISHFDISSLWFVEKGNIVHTGKKPELVLNSLLGGEENILKLRDFTNLPDEFALNRFAFECLCPPQVIETSSLDPQSLQLYDQLKIIWDNKKSINLLDFGAGKGRMIANLVDYDNISPETLNYFAYDILDKDKEYCLKNILFSYNDGENRYYNSLEKMRTNYDDNFFDVVVLSNVLHEIPINKWCEIFKNIRNLLNKDGYILIIEDCRIPIGELPHSNGFLVLNTLHLKKLFKIHNTENKFVVHDARFDSKDQRDRLMAHLIPSSYLNNISIETIKNSLLELKKTSIEEIRKIREKENIYSNGLAHAFWLQQLANATLNLYELGEE